MPKQKQQTSLDAFLGTTKKPNVAAVAVGPKQTKIASFFQKSTNTTPPTPTTSKRSSSTTTTEAATTTTTATIPTTVAKVSPLSSSSSSVQTKETPRNEDDRKSTLKGNNNNINDDDDDDDDDHVFPKIIPTTTMTTTTTTTTKRRSKKNPAALNQHQPMIVDDAVEEDDTIRPTVTTTTSRRNSSRGNNRKRRVIDDDDDDEEEDIVAPTVVTTTTTAAAAAANDSENTTDVVMKTTTLNESKTNSNTDDVENSNNKLPPITTCTSTSSTSQTATTTIPTTTAAAAATTNHHDNNNTLPEENHDTAVNDDTKKSSTKSKKAKTVASGTGTKTNTKTNTKRTVTNDKDDDKKKTKMTIDTTTTNKGSYKSNEEVIQELEMTTSHDHNTASGTATSTTTTVTTVWHNQQPIPYSHVCHTLSNIEQTSSRLAIQELMTTLLRQIILKHCSSSTTTTTTTMPGDDNHDDKNDDETTAAAASAAAVLALKNDIQAIVYIASNTVAPAYECIELGIGDALLMKAIGQATGTNTNMIKQKYETMGDLGTVAQTYKSKQSTLGGFFTKTKPTEKVTSTSSKQRTNYLTAQEVLIAFQQIAQTKGNHSQQWKVDIIKRLLVRTTDPLETRYIIRGLQGKLRIGLAQSTVVLCIAHAMALSSPLQLSPSLSSISTKPFGIKEDDEDDVPTEARQYTDQSQPIEKILEAAAIIVKKAYSEVPSFDAIIDAALRVPLQYFYQVCTLTPGIPVTPMLAKPTKSVQEVLKRLNGLKFTCEYKYDGERAQIHMLSNGTTKVFSRNLLDTSEKYPEVPIFVKEACSYVPIANGAKTTKCDADTTTTASLNGANSVTSCVLDAEVVAWNSKTEQFVPFQILSTRKKTEESAETAKVQVIVQAFDLMYLNGRSLLHRTLSERRALLHEYFHPVPGKFQFAHYLDHTENGDTIVLEEFLENAVKAQCEGLMVKTLDVNAIYEPSRRSLNWLKLKKDYLEGLGDSVDLVPLGAYHGRGKRTGVYGAYLLACYDPDTEDFQSVCKIGTGFSDEMLRTLTDSMSKHIIPHKSSQYKVSDSLECDVWFDTVHVWEVKAADLSKSSTHRGAVGKTGEAGRGIGLRFPRFERIRDDKRPDMATTSDQILEMYYQQDSIVEGDNAIVDDDDDGI